MRETKTLNLTTNEITTEYLPDDYFPEQLLFVPTSVTMRQARIALHRNGLLSGVEAAIQTMEEPFRTEVKIAWEYAQTVDVDSQFTQMLAMAIGLNQEQLNDLFIQASTL